VLPITSAYDLIRACLAGLLPDSSSGSCKGALANVFLDEPFSVKYRGVRAILEESGSSKTALAPLEEPLERSRAKHPLKKNIIMSRRFNTQVH
jgi:hypothetical protein